MAKLYFHYGPMGSQKSAKLLQNAYNFEEHGGKVLVAKSPIDIRDGDFIKSRNGLSRKTDLLISPDMEIIPEVLKRRKKGEKISALLIDEAQFLTPKQVDELWLLTVEHGLPVMAYGLRSDFRTLMFPGSRRLFELAHNTRELITMCGVGDGCESRALFNARKLGNEYVTEGDQVAIDGNQDVTYVSLCGPHYLQHVGPIQADY